MGNSLIRESGSTVILGTSYMQFRNALIAETADRCLSYIKTPGYTSSLQNTIFRFGIIGGIDAINPFWNGHQLEGHTITNNTGTTNYPMMTTYSRSTTATNPSDYEFITEVGNIGNNVGLSYYAPYISGSSVNFGFGSTKKLLLSNMMELICLFVLGTMQQNTPIFQLEVQET